MNAFVSLLDEALSRLQSGSVSESKLFEINHELLGDDFTKLVSVRVTAIPMTMEFSENGIDVHLARSSEVFSWGKEYIAMHADKIVETFVLLLTSKFEVVTYGKKIKRIFFLDPATNKVIKKINAIDGLIFNPLRSKKEHFSPLIHPPVTPRIQ